MRRRIDARVRQASSAGSPVFAGAFGVDHDGRAGLDARGRHRPRMRGTSPMIPCCSIAHFRNAALTPVSSMPSRISRTNSSVDHVVRAVGQEARQLEEVVDARRDDDVEVDLGVDALDAGDEAAKPRDGRVDDRADPAAAQTPQLLHGIGDAHVLVPVALAPGVPVVLQRLGVHDEDVLVHERRPQVGDVNCSAYGLNGAQRLGPLVGRYSARRATVLGYVRAGSCPYERGLARTVGV